GVTSAQLRPWQQIQQTSMPGEGNFDDLPLASGMGQTRQAELRGTVTETRNARLAGHTQTNKLAKVQLQDGTTIFADLGPAQNFQRQNIRLSRGDQVSISGSPAWLNNQPVLFAER